LNALLQRSASEQTLRDLLAVFEQMKGYRPNEPHWYLPLIGVDPFQQGKGLGSALMRHALARCDSERKAAFLESSNPKNVSFYERHGFEVLGRIQVGASPILFPMLRNAR
jgi:ribosomal protein S18 acetylase RimI-like enzyme